MTNTKAGLAILGGTFDPPHLAHLIVAQDATEALGLTEVCFMPASRNPLKQTQPGVSDAHRLGMLQALCEHWPQYCVDTYELDAGGQSYTVQTAEYLRRRYPDRTLYWIIGTDHLAQLHEWKEVDHLATLVEFVCFSRPGYNPVSPEIEDLTLHRFEGHPFSLSSTDIRWRLAQGMPVELFLPEPVLHYIQTNKLYT